LHDFSVRRQCAEYAAGQGGLAATGFAHDPESTAATELEGDLTDGVQAAIHKAVVDGKPINLKDDIRFRVTHGH
jgi:hypothetical protein